MAMQEMEECPISKKRATWETILDGKVWIVLVAKRPVFIGNNSLWECMDIHFNLALSLESFDYTGSLIQADDNYCKYGSCFFSVTSEFLT